MSDMPIWVAVIVAFLILSSSVFCLLGTYGLFRFRGFYPRVHAPTLGTTFGAIGMCLASILYFSFSNERPFIHEVLIIAFITTTTPATIMLLTRAALYRDRRERKETVPNLRYIKFERGDPESEL